MSPPRPAEATTTNERSGGRTTQGVIARYFEQLPVSDSTPVVTLGEGDTPLLHSERLSEETGAVVWLKHEGLNPTGSFKDRGMTVAVSKALEQGARAIVCASTGNTSASAAAYAARAGIPCAVIVPAGMVARGKLAQALIHGSRVCEIDGGFDTALSLSREVAKRRAVTLVNSVNPYRIEGQKTAAFEIVEALGSAPDLHLMPVGNAGNITAHWRGYREAERTGWAPELPRMFGFQAAGANPIVRGEPIPSPRTIATAIRIGNPASWRGAVEAARASGGAIRSVTDGEILSAYTFLAAEGIFVEPAAAASVAGLRHLHRGGWLSPDARVVCVLTGHGLKDPDRALEEAPEPHPLPADLAAVVEALGLG